MWVHLNDKLVSAEDALVSVFDRGFTYGDGVFETMRAWRRRVFRLGAHLDRLAQSAAALKIRTPFNSEEIARHVDALIDRNGLEDAVVRIAISRGPGARGVAMDPNSRPTYVVTAEPPPANLEERRSKGISLAIAGLRRVPAEALPAHAKHANYLNAVLANAEAAAAGAEEALMLSIGGYVAECSTGNIFLVTGARVLTPAPEIGILPGITRAALIASATVEETILTTDDVFAADEIFMTNSVVGIMPVRRVDSREYRVRGEKTLQIMKAYDELVQNSLQGRGF
jgi:branched-chain amino acid aminotransferase